MASSMFIKEWIIQPTEVQRGRIIGSGGFGTVYVATWKKLSVAVKYFQKDKVSLLDTKFVMKEVELLAKLRHPHIIEFLGANVTGSEPFIVMAYHQNGDARSYVGENPGCDRMKILYDIVLGLVYLHSLKLIHGDLKAVNVLIDDALRAVLCDLGLSRIKANTSTRTLSTEEDMLAGSRGWMAPERLLGKKMRLASDIYSFGIMIYEIFTLEIPFSEAIPGELRTMIAKEGIRPERPQDDDLDEDGLTILIPDDMWDLAENCWKTDPGGRPTADAVRLILVEMCGSHTSSEPDADNASPSSQTVVPQGHQAGEGGTEVQTPSQSATSTARQPTRIRPIVSLASLPARALFSIFAIVSNYSSKDEELLYHLSSTCHALHTACLNVLFTKHSQVYHINPAVISIKDSYPSFILPALRSALFFRRIQGFNVLFDNPAILLRDIQIVRSLIKDYLIEPKVSGALYLEFKFSPSHVQDPYINSNQFSKVLQEILEIVMVERGHTMWVFSNEAFDEALVAGVDPESSSTFTPRIRSGSDPLTKKAELYSRICFERPMLQWTIGFVHHIQPVNLEISSGYTPGLAEAFRLVHIPTLTHFTYTQVNASKLPPLLPDSLAVFLSRHAPKLTSLEVRLLPSHPLQGSFSEALSSKFGADAHEPWFPRAAQHSTVHVINFRSLEYLYSDVLTVGWVLKATLNAFISAPEPPASLPESAQAPSDTLRISLDQYVTVSDDDFHQSVNEALTALALIAILGQETNPLTWRRYDLYPAHFKPASTVRWITEHANSLAANSPFRCSALGASIHQLGLGRRYFSGAGDVAALPQFLTLFPNLEYMRLLYVSTDFLDRQPREFWESVRKSCPKLKYVDSESSGFGGHLQGPKS